MKNKLVLSFVLLLIAFSSLRAQNSTNSPYTRWGYGELADPSYGAQKAMGGIGIGVSESHMINPMNPASFSKVDSMTFMLDMAVSGQLSWYDDGYNKSDDVNGKVEYVALQFPLYKRLGMGLGFKPVSYVGYKYGEIDNDNNSIVFSGNGGLNQLYGALSYGFKQLSVGVNVGYIFGNIYHTEQATFSNAATYPYLKSDSLSISGFSFDIGLQYTQPLGKDYKLVVGAVYTPKMRINGDYSGTEITYNSSGYIQSIDMLPSRSSDCDMPEVYAAGVSFSKNEKYMIGLDYAYEKWEDVQFEGVTGAFQNRSKINFGGEFIPNARSRNYFNKIRLRAGANYADSYMAPVAVYDDKAHSFNEYSVTCGLGFPLTGGRSMLNVAFEYANTKPKNDVPGLINEKYFKFTLSYTFNEMWFFKRKVQ